MRIFNQNKTKEIINPNLDKGYLVQDKRFVAHHNAIEGIEEQGHWKTIRKYPNGGEDVEWVTDIPAVKAKDAYDEYEDIKVYILYTEEELKQRRIAQLKVELARVKEDIEQETFGLVRDDYSEKKARAAEIINELRVLEGKEPRAIKTE